jgi:L,D-peptidoglycan transpeptidase YkuD (ErfK/YbiS/YcfS/YnhG family)
LRTFERAGDAWREIDAAREVTIGRAGAAWGLGLHDAQSDGPQKREGDGRSPAGVFEIGAAFGYPASIETGLTYQAMQSSHWCVDVPGSPLYNRIVDSSDVGTAAVKDSTEPMRRDLHVKGDQRYRIGFVIEHNPDGRDRAGSCIFAHVWKSPADATAGCTAMSDANMAALLRWLDRRRSPRFVLLPEAEYARLRAAWALPLKPAR